MMHRGTLIFGTSELAGKVAKILQERTDSHEPLLGVVSEYRGLKPEGFPCAHLGSVANLAEIIASMAPGRVVVAPSKPHLSLPVGRLVETRVREKVVVETGEEALERLTGKIAIESMPNREILLSGDFCLSSTSVVVARLVSVVGAAVGLLLSLPLMLVIAAAIRLDTPGPVLFVQERIGLGGRRFKLFKFRSMSAEQVKHSEWASDNASAITRVGRLLRKFRLDELPQFINVALGDMNLVGPRPHPESNRQMFVLVSRNTAQCGDQIPCYSLRQSVRPGITGWAQVRYKYANGLNEEMEKLRYDLYYIKHFSPRLDLRILLETVKVVLKGHDDNKAPRQQRIATRTAKTSDAVPDAPALSVDSAPKRLQTAVKLRSVQTGNVQTLAGHKSEEDRYSGH